MLDIGLLQAQATPALCRAKQPPARIHNSTLMLHAEPVHLPLDNYYYLITITKRAPYYLGEKKNNIGIKISSTFIEGF